MTSSDISPLFGGLTTQSGQRVGSGIARQTKREVETVAARAEVAYVTDQARGFLTSSALNNVGTLVGQAEQLMKVAPAGAQFYESILTAYAIGAAQSVANFR